MVSFRDSDNKENEPEIVGYNQKPNKRPVRNPWIIPEKKRWHVGMEEMSAKSQMGKYFVEFASNSSIHGLNHLVARHRHPLERLLAGMIILVGFASFLYVSILSWYRYQNDGFVILQDIRPAVMRVSKPALVICPSYVIEESKFPTTFKRYGLKDTPQARTFFYFLSNVTYDKMEELPDYKDAPAELWLKILNDLKRDFYYETSFPGSATWIITEQGLCVSIGNYVTPYAGVEYLINNNLTTWRPPMSPSDTSDFAMENKEIHDPNYLPSYIYEQNRKIIETLILDTQAEIHYFDPLGGFKLMQFAREVNNTGEVLHNIGIDVTNAMNGIEKVSVRRRRCKFASDKGLKLWPIYNFQLCLTEHRADIIKKYCGCYPHFVKRMPGVPVCNVTQLRCAGKQPKIRKTILRIDKPIDNCLWNCDHVKYSIALKLINTGPVNITNITFILKFPGTRYRRKEKFSFIDFMTSVGGAAGLFLGCSVLSFVEIFYYGTLRLWIHERKYKQK